MLKKVDQKQQTEIIQHIARFIYDNNLYFVKKDEDKEKKLSQYALLRFTYATEDKNHTYHELNIDEQKNTIEGTLIYELQHIWSKHGDIIEFDMQKYEALVSDTLQSKVIYSDQDYEPDGSLTYRSVVGIPIEKMMDCFMEQREQTVFCEAFKESQSPYQLRWNYTPVFHDTSTHDNAQTEAVAEVISDTQLAGSNNKMSDTAPDNLTEPLPPLPEKSSIDILSHKKEHILNRVIQLMHERKTYDTLNQQPEEVIYSYEESLMREKKQLEQRLSHINQYFEKLPEKRREHLEDNRPDSQEFNAKLTQLLQEVKSLNEEHANTQDRKEKPVHGRLRRKDRHATHSMDS